MANNDDIKEGLTEYKVRIFGRIPLGWVAVKKSVFNYKIIKFTNGGVFFNSPFWKVKLVKVKEEDHDYKPEVFEDVRGADITLDTVLTTKVTNPILYESAHENPMEKLKNILDAYLRVMLKKYPYSFLASQRFNLPNGPVLKRDDTIFTNIKSGGGSYVGDRNDKPVFPAYSKDKEYDSTYRNQLQECVNYDLALLRYELEEFAKKYGISVVNFECKKVMPSEEVRKRQEELEIAHQDVLIEEEKRKKAIIAAKATAESEKIRLENIRKFAESLPEEQRQQFLRDYLYTNGTHSDTSKESSAAVAGAVAGMTSNANTKTKK